MVLLESPALKRQRAAVHQVTGAAVAGAEDVVVVVVDGVVASATTVASGVGRVVVVPGAAVEGTGAEGGVQATLWALRVDPVPLPRPMTFKLALAPVETRMSRVALV